MTRVSWMIAILVVFSMLSMIDGARGQDQSLVVLSNIEIITVEEDQMVVTWVTNMAADTTVLYGENSSLGNTALGEGDTRYHYCSVSDLEPDSEYFIQVTSGGKTSSILTFRTLIQTPLPTMKIAVVADIHYDTDGNNMPNGAMYGESPDLMDALLREFDNRNDIEVVILLGDNVQGDEADWTALYDNTMGPSGFEYYPVLGNWDKNSADWETYYADHAGLPSTYFSIDIGGLHLVILDSAVEGQVGGGMDNDQLDWLEDDLTENSDMKVLIFLHHLYYADDVMGLDQDSFNSLKGIVDENPNILNIFSGHNHRNTYSDSEDRTQTTSVASLVQYPIGYTTLDLWEDGYSQSYYKVEETLDISENSRLRVQASTGDPKEDQRYLGTIHERNHILTFKENSRPEVLDIRLGRDEIGMGEETSVTVEAFDPDGDDLEYTYDVSGGEIIGSGTEVTYRAPEILGEYWIEATVSDGLLDSEPFRISIEVITDPQPEPDPEPEPDDNRPPKIETIIASPLEVLIEGEVRIRVYATDPDDDPLEYEYSNVNGQIIGEGNDVIWKAPSSVGPQSVTIRVTDGHSYSDPEEILIEVIEEGTDTKDSPSLSLLLILMIPCILGWTMIIKGIRKR